METALSLGFAGMIIFLVLMTSINLFYLLYMKGKILGSLKEHHPSIYDEFRAREGSDNGVFNHIMKERIWSPWGSQLQIELERFRAVRTLLFFQVAAFALLAFYLGVLTVLVLLDKI
jgi:hypothetical protein